MILLMLLACRPYVPDPPPTTNPSRETDDTGVDTLDSDPGWGTCASQRRVDVLSGDDTEDSPRVAMSADGSRTLVASHSGPLTLDPDTTVVPAGETGWVVARHDADAALQWSVVMDGTRQAGLNDLDAHADGGVWLAGSSDGLTTLGPWSDPDPQGESDGLVARLGPDGELLWARTLSSTGDDVLDGVAALDDGGVVITGSVGVDPVLGVGEPGELTVVVPEGARNVGFVARLGADGTLQWVRTFAGAEQTWPADVEVDGEELTVIGQLLGPGATVFGAGTPTERAIEPANTEAFTARYSTDGELIWVASAGGAYASATAVATGPDGAVFVAGDFYDAVTIGRGSPTEASFVAAEVWDLWLARYEADGTLAWATRSTSPSYGGAHVEGLVRIDDGVVALGTMVLTVLGDGEPTQVRFTATWQNAIAAVFDDDGALRCALHLPADDATGTGLYATSGLDHGVVRSDGGLELVGTFYNQVMLGDAVELDALEQDLFVLTVDLL